MASKLVLVVLCALAASAAARTSPNADDILRQFAGRHSNDVLEDALLDAPGLITKYGYPVEVHHVTTSDGYILETHRIPYGRDNRDPDRPIVFLMHGLLSSSADWINMGPNTGLGYILAEEGFDVWMGNARGNYYSRRHLTLNPDRGVDFWDFSWHEIGHIDLAAYIDYILEKTGRSGLHYIGHSQGTTSFFVLASTRPEYNDKILSMHAFAPVAYMSNSENPLFNLLAPYANQIEAITNLIGLGELLPNSDLTTWAGSAFCQDNFPFQEMCMNIFFLMGGSNVDQFNSTMIPVKLGHAPAGASTQQFVHYGQGIVSGKFRQYDHGLIRNRIKYGSFTPPDYDLSKITAPVCLHYSGVDPLAHVLDVDQLFRELGNPVGKFLVPDSKFSHIDFIWAIDARELLYNRAINLIRAFDRA